MLVSILRLVCNCGRCRIGSFSRAVDIVELECERRDWICTGKKRFETVPVCADNAIIRIELITKIVPIDDAEVLQHFIDLRHFDFIARLDCGFELQQDCIGDCHFGLVGADVNGQRSSFVFFVDFKFCFVRFAVRFLSASCEQHQYAAAE